MNEALIALIVLGAGLYLDKEVVKPSAQTKSNLEKAAQYLRLNNNFNDKPLVFSGGYTLKHFTEAEVMYYYFLARYNVSHSHPIYLESQSRNSAEQIVLLLNLCQKFRWKQIILIDQPAHFGQLKLLFRKELKIRKTQLKIEWVPATQVWGMNYQKQWSNPIMFYGYELLANAYYFILGQI